MWRLKYMLWNNQWVIKNQRKNREYIETSIKYPKSMTWSISGSKTKIHCNSSLSQLSREI